MMIAMVFMKVEFGPMGVHETNALKGDIYTTAGRPYANAEGDAKVNPRGKVIDLLIPIISLVICCVIGMIYTGGFFSGTDFVTAFSQSDASVGLVLGSFFALVITIVLYLVRRVMNFRDCMACLPEGFKAMVPAILILSFAWTLKAMTDSLGASDFVYQCCKIFCRRSDEPASCYYLRDRCSDRICHRYFLGNFRYPDPYRSRCIFRNES